MFGTLSNVFKEEWLSNKENHYINFSTLNNNMVWEVFSTYTIEKKNIIYRVILVLMKSI